MYLSLLTFQKPLKKLVTIGSLSPQFHLTTVTIVSEDKATDSFVAYRSRNSIARVNNWQLALSANHRYVESWAQFSILCGNNMLPTLRLG